MQAVISIHELPKAGNSFADGAAFVPGLLPFANNMPLQKK
jgi:hypothetical protein